jgi:hypothetical protein
MTTTTTIAKHEAGCDCYRCAYDDEVTARVAGYRKAWEASGDEDDLASLRRAEESARIYFATRSTRTA